MRAAWSGDDVAVAWTGFEDKVTHIDHYRVVTGTPRSPKACQGDGAVEVRAAQWTARGIDPERPPRIRICAVDAGGNVSDGAVVRVGRRPSR